MLDHLKDKPRKYKKLMKTVKPKLLEKARTLQGNCSFFQYDKLSRVFVNSFDWLPFVLLLEVTVNQEIPSFREGIV